MQFTNFASVGLTIGLAAIGLALPAKASIVYDNGGPNHTGASDMVLSLEADDFSLAATATITSAQFWDFETPGGGDFAGSIAWFIYANDATNLPAALLFSGSASGGDLIRVATGVADPSGQFAEYSDTFNFTPAVTLDPGRYWLGLHNGPVSPVDPNSLANFAWELASTDCTEVKPLPQFPFNVCGRAMDLTSDGAPFLTTSSEDAFNILAGEPVSTAPEPGSMALLGIGLLYVCISRRKQ